MQSLFSKPLPEGEIRISKLDPPQADRHKFELPKSPITQTGLRALVPKACPPWRVALGNEKAGSLTPAGS
jgi:hypothetical protein